MDKVYMTNTLGGSVSGGGNGGGQTNFNLGKGLV